MSVAVVLMAYGSPDRLEDVPAYYADIRGGRPISPERLDDLVARYRRLGIEESNPLNEITEATRAALEAELGPARLHRHAPLEAADRGGGRAGARRWRRRRSSGSCSRRTTRPSRSRSTGSRSCRRSDGRAELRFVERWGSEPGFVALLAQRLELPQARARRLHRALAARPDPRRGRSVPRRAARDRAPRRRERRRAASGRSPSRASRRPASRGSGRTSSSISTSSPPATSATSSSARSGSSPTTSRSAGTSTSRRAERARELGIRLERIELPNADPAFIRGARGPRPAGGGCTVSWREDGPDPRRGGLAPLPRPRERGAQPEGAVRPRRAHRGERRRRRSRTSRSQSSRARRSGSSAGTARASRRCSA